MLPEAATPLLPFFHPTTVVHVEDSTSYSTLLQSVLEPEILVSRHRWARKALTAIEAAHARPSVSRNLVERFRKDRTLSAADLGAIRGIVDDPQRFNDVAVAIVDYAMPDLDGLGFCRQLAGTPVGRVMLTARADRRIATQALDEGLIDYFIDKTSPDFLERIRDAVSALQARYFGADRHFGFADDADARFGFARDPGVAAALRRYLTIAPVEMYLCDDPTGVLFIDAEGLSEFVLVFSEAVYERRRQAALGAGAPPWYADHLADRQWIDWRGDADGFFRAGHAVTPHDLLRATVLQGRNGDVVVATLDQAPPWKQAECSTYRGWLDQREHAGGATGA